MFRGGIQHYDVLLIHRYFGENTTPCGAILKRLAVLMRDCDGFKVRVITTGSEEMVCQDLESRGCAGKAGQLSISRLCLQRDSGSFFNRLMNAFAFFSFILKNLRGSRFSYVVATSIPPIIGGVAGLVIKILGRCKFIYFCMDVHPETLRISPKIYSRILTLPLMCVDVINCLFADKVVVHSPDMSSTLKARVFGSFYKITIINNFALDERSVTCNDNSIAQHSDAILILYAGNIGRFQALDSFLLRLACLSEQGIKIKLVVYGDGTRRNHLEELSRALPIDVEFRGVIKSEHLRSMLPDFDYGLVSLAPMICRYAYPSKILTYLEAGLPLLLNLDSTSEVSSSLVKSGVAVNVSQSRNVDLLEIFRSLPRGSGRAVMARSAKRYYYQNFSQSIAYSKWRDILS